MEKTNEHIELQDWIDQYNGIYITITQAARLLKPFCSYSKLRRALYFNEIPFPIKKIGARYYALRTDVIKYKKHLSDKFKEEQTNVSKTEQQCLSPIEIQNDWITLNEVVTMTNGILSYATLKKMSKQGNAPFIIRRIGHRYFARREDVETCLANIKKDVYYNSSNLPNDSRYS